MKKVILVIVVLLIEVACATANGHDYYVAGTGSDMNPGTKELPFLTLEKAQSVVRDARPTATEGITVWVRGGRYYLDQPLVFGPDDSGTASVPVAYSGYADETVVLSGAKLLTPTWRPYSGRIQVATAGAKAIIDYAADNNYQYVHYDAGWYGPERAASSNPLTVKSDIDMPGVIRYGRDRGIGLICYINKIAMSKYDLDHTLSTYEKWGISGVKYGFVDWQTQADMEFLYAAIKKAAQYHLIVDIHDNFRLTGIERTYPNVLTVARKKGKAWFVGTITNDARTLDIPLSFLEDGTYTAKIYKEDPANKKHVTIESLDVTSRSSIAASMSSASGHAMWICPTESR